MFSFCVRNRVLSHLSLQLLIVQRLHFLPPKSIPQLALAVGSLTEGLVNLPIVAEADGVEAPKAVAPLPLQMAISLPHPSLAARFATKRDTCLWTAIIEWTAPTKVDILHHS